MSTSDTRCQLHELHRAGQVQRRRFGLFVGILVFASCGLFGWSATSAQAATDSLFAAPSAVGAGDCSSQADACPIATAVTNANGEPVDDSVTIELAGGTYALPSPSPTALTITFAGPSLTLKADGGTPILDGMNTVRLLSIGSASNVTIDGLEIDSARTAEPAVGSTTAGRSPSRTPRSRATPRQTAVGSATRPARRSPFRTRRFRTTGAPALVVARSSPSGRPPSSARR